MDNHLVAIHKKRITRRVKRNIPYHALNIGKVNIHAHNANRLTIFIDWDDIGNHVGIDVFIVVRLQPDGMASLKRSIIPAHMLCI